MNEIITKRKLQLDHFSEGLSSLGFSDLLSSFTEEFKAVFVGGDGGGVSLNKLLSIIDFNDADNTDGRCTLAYLRQYLTELDEKGIVNTSAWLASSSMQCKYSLIIHSGRFQK